MKNQVQLCVDEVWSGDTCFTSALSLFVDEDALDEATAILRARVIEEFSGSGYEVTAVLFVIVPDAPTVN